MQSWAARELKGANLGDKRLNRRLVKIVEALCEQPEASLPQACGSWAATKAAYNFFSSKQVSPQEILEAHESFWREQLTSEAVVLAIQDTSDFNFTHHRSKSFAQGFGLTGTQSYVRGLKVHSILGVSVQGVPWGLLMLTYHARVHPQIPSDHFFENVEWQSLYCRIYNTPIPPTTPPSLGQVVRWLAALGGFLGRSGDGQPGVKTLWRGLRRLHDIAQTWQLAHPP